MGCALSRNTILVILCCCIGIKTWAQRSYKPQSVLSEGAWYKIAVKEEGVHRVDAAFLTALGITGSIPSAGITVFGRADAFSSEALSAPYTDDLDEVAIQVVDGGDGIINGSDYFLFYTKGPHAWKADTASRRFTHQKNIYSDVAYYYISVGSNGKRIASQTMSFTPSITVNSFDERYFYEPDSINFLRSGKEWYGSEWSSLPGHSLVKQFAVPVTSPVVGSAFTLVTSTVGRSLGIPSRIAASLNGSFVHGVTMPAVGGGLYDRFAQPGAESTTGLLNTTSVQLTYTYTPGSFNAQAWLNWFQFFYRRQLVIPANGQLHFRDWNSLGTSGVGFKIANANNSVQVWDVSNPLAPVKMMTTLSGAELSFVNDGTALREYIAVGNSFFTPQPVGKVTNQNLHASTEKDYLIVTHPVLLAEAQRLALFHQTKNGLRTLVVTTEQVYNEFSAGQPTPVALRDFFKMYYDRYRTSWNKEKKYALLFGKGSYDYKSRIANNTNLVPVYESEVSLDPLASYTSDDFFGFLDDNEDINSGLVLNLLDISLGRIPAKNVAEAKAFVDKVHAYHAAASLGPWRNNINLVADDEDANLHLQDAEVLARTTLNTAPLFNPYKIYLDAFLQESGASGGRYPAANNLINNNLYNGTLIWNYSGHGGPSRLAEEVVLDQQMVNALANEHRLPLMITATCDFAPHDNPVVASLGENLLLRPKTGAIALTTTTRIVFAYSNRIINDNYLRFALQKDSAQKYKSLGGAMLATKNYTYTTSGDITNNRKFTLIGDPALTLAFPRYNAMVTSVNGQSISSRADTLSAMEFVLIEGEIRDELNNRLTAFNGRVYLSVFDKPQNVTTLGNDAGSTPTTFSAQTAALFKGKVSASAGKFSFRFRLPKDINYRFDSGKLSLYAEDSATDGSGYSKNIIIGGISNSANTDKEGPVIKAFLNNDRFVSGSITNETPVLLLRLSDSSGINTGNAGIDHDIVATLDGDNRKYYVLNDFYETALDSYQQGTVRFQLPRLQPGPHQIKIKAWDVVNNSGEIVLDFIVANDEELVLDHVLNYPNPFAAKTTFWFEHNKPGTDLHVKVEILTITGKIIKTLNRAINTEGNRSSEVEWDGRDEWGDRVAEGVYLYRLVVRTPDGKMAAKIKPLVVIQ